MAISCVYCGASHPNASEVRACWARQVEDSTPTGPAALHPEVAADPELAADPALAPNPLAAQPGPDALGRNLVVLAGAPIPEAWAAAPVETITAAVLADPEPIVARLRDRAAVRHRTVFALHTPLPRDRPPLSVESRMLHELGPQFEMSLDALHHLVWSNSIDATEPECSRWAPGDRAIQLGAQPAANGLVGDVVLADGRTAWLDGGPLTHFGDLLQGAEVVPMLAIEHGSLVPLGPNEPGPTAGELAPDQHAAVTHPGGAARIIAPAGSGKTRVLTERARHLLTRWRVPAGAVCLVSFNTRAQAEMRERTRDLPGLQVRTLNSLALAIVNGTHPFVPRRTAARRTIDEPDVRRLLDRLVKVPKRRNTDPTAPWIDALSVARLGLADPVEVEARYDGDVAGFADVYPQYRDELRRENALDFDEQIVGAIEVLLTDPAARIAAQRSCRLLLVDEFQDLAPAHLLLIRLLAGPALQVFGVGDDDQTIYGYQGADPAWLIHFASLFPGSGDHPLEVNYRCPEGIVAAADRLLRRNRHRVQKRIRAARVGEIGWRSVAADNTLAATVGAVREAIAAGRTPGEIAVLTRVNALLAPVQVALHGSVPVQGGVGREFTQRTAVRATLAWLRLAAGEWRPDDLAEALRRPSRPLHPNVIAWVGETRDLAGLSRLADRLRTPRDADRVASFGVDIERLRQMVEQGKSTAAVVGVLFHDLGLAGSVSTLDLNRQGMNRGAQNDDLTALEQLATLQPDASRFPAWLAESLDRGRGDGDSDGVTLATVHRVKGQEWPMVVVHEASDAQFPHRLAEDIEEERRLFHVAITRASAEAIIVCPLAGPSPFIRELSTEPSERDLRAEPAAPVSPSRKVADATSSSPLRDKARVIAVPGLVLVDQGTEWVVEAVSPAGADARHDPATRQFRTGSKVATAGGASGELTPRSDTDPLEQSVRAFDLLRTLRRRLAQGKPAYTVFDDATMERLALALPRDLAAVARVQGIGPAKLEQYGDAILTIVEDAIG